MVPVKSINKYKMDIILVMWIYSEVYNEHFITFMACFASPDTVCSTARCRRINKSTLGLYHQQALQTSVGICEHSLIRQPSVRAMGTLPTAVVVFLFIYEHYPIRQQNYQCHWKLANYTAFTNTECHLQWRLKMPAHYTLNLLINRHVMILQRHSSFQTSIFEPSFVI